VHHEMRHLLGSNLFDLTHDLWLPRRRALQPIFTKQHVREFGGHMAQAAHTVADSWGDGTDVDLDTERRRLTLRALGRSVLGLDLDDHSDAIAEPLRVATKYVADRAVRASTPEILLAIRAELTGPTNNSSTVTQICAVSSRICGLCKESRRRRRLGFPGCDYSHKISTTCRPTKGMENDADRTASRR
jgi:hypothetical protein